MSRPTRLIAGILTLLALTFSFAESVWASTCSPLMEMDVPATGAGETGMDMDGPATAGPGEASMAMGHRGAEPDGHGRDRHEDEQPCPFGAPAATQACAAASSMPAHTSPLPAPSLEGMVVVLTVDLGRDLLLERALFRPPRA